LAEFSLVVLDECHHTKNNHPMNAIMRDHYFTTVRPLSRGTLARP
jgi:hypothetical protein